MASEVATVLLSLIGVGVIVVGILILMEMNERKETTKVVVREPRWSRWGPYYSHLARPILY